MYHPFFNKKRLLIIYSTIWLGVAKIQFLILVFKMKVDVLPAAFDSIIFNLIFGLLGTSIWYVIRNTKPSKPYPINILINHLTSACILIAVWLGLSKFILFGIFNNNQIYCDFLEASSIWRIISGLFLYSILVLIYYIIIYYNDLQEKNSSKARLNEIIRTTELNMLKSQINPHFLFNSLNSISSLTITNPVKAQEMIVKLSDFLRYSISNDSNQLSDVASEMSNTKRYLDIEQIRFGEKLIQEYKIEDKCMQAKIPSMILQPLYENAVKHGVYESTEPIKIFTKCFCNDKILNITITNNFDPNAIPRKGEGIGLKNIKERLRLIYKNDKLLSTEKSDKAFTVHLSIPQTHN